LILHDVQANGKGALTLEPTVLDPRLVVLKGNTDSSSSSRASLALPKVSKTPYNKGRKREITESTDNTDKALLPVPKKIDLGVAITSLSKEIARSREAKLSYESNQQRAIKLLGKEYKARLKTGAFLKAVTLFKDKGNAITFLALDDREYRDLWLEMETNSHLL
jgi:hypothetical protein